MIRRLSAVLPAALLAAALAGPAAAAPTIEGVDVPANFSVQRTSPTTLLVTGRVVSDSPSTTVTRVLHTRGSKTLANQAGKGTAVRQSLANVKVGDYVTLTATDAHGHTDRETRRVVFGPMSLRAFGPQTGIAWDAPQAGRGWA